MGGKGRLVGMGGEKWTEVYKDRVAKHHYKEFG